MGISPHFLLDLVQGIFSFTFAQKAVYEGSSKCFTIYFRDDGRVGYLKKESVFSLKKEGKNSDHWCCVARMWCMTK